MYIQGCCVIYIPENEDYFALSQFTNEGLNATNYYKSKMHIYSHICLNLLQHRKLPTLKIGRKKALYKFKKTKNDTTLWPSLSLSSNILQTRKQYTKSAPLIYSYITQELDKAYVPCLCYLREDVACYIYL